MEKAGSDERDGITKTTRIHLEAETATITRPRTAVISRLDEDQGQEPEGSSGSGEGELEGAARDTKSGCGGRPSHRPR